MDTPLSGGKKLRGREGFEAPPNLFLTLDETLGVESVTLNIDFEVSTQGKTRHKRRERKTSYSRKIAPKAREIFAILGS